MTQIFDSSFSALRASVAIGAMALGVAAPAHAIVYDFKPAFGGVNADFTLGGDLHVEMTENLATAAGDDVLFKFTNQIAEPDAFIARIYFDLGSYGGLFSNMAVTETGGTVNLVSRTVDPTVRAHPFLPTDFYAEYFIGLSTTYPYSDGTIYGIHPGEYAVLTGTLGGGYSFADALAALDVGTGSATGLRVGVNVLHTKGNDPADLSTYYDDVGYVTNSVVAVPEAETWAMMLAGLGLVGFMGRRRMA